MKKSLLPSLTAFMLASVVSISQAQNPYESLGKKAKVLTLSDGRYEEFFPNDTLVQVGSVILNTITGKVVAFAETDTLYSESSAQPEIISRFTSPDPVADKYPQWSPYVYTFNNPINFTDPDGRDPCPECDDPDIVIRLVATAWFGTKHSIINLVKNAFSPTDPGMKWEASYKTDGNGNQIFETEVKQVPSQGAVRDAAGLALDAVNVIGAKAISPTDVLGAQNGGRTQITETARDAINAADDVKGVRNASLAGGTHPKTGVPFDNAGFPDFSKNLYKGGASDVMIKPTGNRNTDFTAANKAAGYDATPKGQTWHHHQTTGRMQLVDTRVHSQTGHTGGFSLWKK